MGFGYSGGQVEWKRNRAQAISSLLRVRTCSLPSAVCNYTHEEGLGLPTYFLSNIGVALREWTCFIMWGSKSPFCHGHDIDPDCKYVEVSGRLATYINIAVLPLPFETLSVASCWTSATRFSLSLINIELSGSGLCWIGPGSNTTRWKMRLLNTIRLQEHLDTILGEKVLCSMCC